MTIPTEWYKDNYFISTKSSLIQPDAVNAAFDSKLLYWTRAIQDDKLLKTMLDSSLCFGVYQMPTSSSEIAGRGSPQQIGLARLITDNVTFAYLTDVYILEEHQGKGLGSWLISCVNEVVSAWPELRRMMLITSDSPKFYAEKLGMKEFNQGGHGMLLLNRKGGGSVLKDWA